MFGKKLKSKIKKIILQKRNIVFTKDDNFEGRTRSPDKKITISPKAKIPCKAEVLCRRVKDLKIIMLHFFYYSLLLPITLSSPLLLSFFYFMYLK